MIEDFHSFVLTKASKKGQQRTHNDFKPWLILLFMGPCNQ